MPEYMLEESTGSMVDGDERSFKVQILPEDTICEAVLLDVKEKIAPFKNDDGSEIKRVEFTFALPDYNNQRIWGETPTTFTTHPDCKLRGWVQEIMGGQELPPGFKLNTDTLRDAHVRVRLGYRTWQDKKTNETKERNFVADVIHSRQTVSALVEDPF